MRKVSLVASLVMSGALATLAGACGARTGLDSLPTPPPPPECFVDSDCDGSGDMCNPVVCQLFSADAGADAGDAGAAAKQPGGTCVALTPVNCDDGDPCTLDNCDSTNGACSHPPATQDLDGDGHRAPLPGKIPGSPGSCGDDCDDTNPNAHPGAKEVCDGVDNDCNGIVDDNATYVPTTDPPVRIDGELAPADPGGIAWSGTSYAAIYGGTTQGYDMYRSMLAPSGDPLAPEARVTEVNADSSGGPIAWIGDRYGLAWEDRRDGDYEIYFTLLKESGEKALADTRLTFASGFSIHPSMVWTGSEFLVVWQDDRNGGVFQVYGQRVDFQGNPINGNVNISELAGPGNESPVVAPGLSGSGVVWSHGDSTSEAIEFQIVGTDLTPIPAMPQPIKLTDGSTQAVDPVVVYNKGKADTSGNYVVAWFDRTANPAAVYGTVISETGAIVVPVRALTNPGTFRSRYPTMRPLGDRLLLVYSDDRDQNDGYELYSRLIAADLSPLGPELRLTDAPQDSVYPTTSFGPLGDVGVLFRDDRVNGEHHIFFTRLACVTHTVD